MGCGFNPACHVWRAVEPFWFWLQLGFWIAVALVALWALAKLKEVGGWPAVAAALAAGSYGLGWLRGRRGKPLVPDHDPVFTEKADAEPSPTIFRRKPKPIDPPKPGTRTRWNEKEGKFEKY